MKVNNIYNIYYKVQNEKKEVINYVKVFEGKGKSMRDVMFKSCFQGRKHKGCANVL